MVSAILADPTLDEVERKVSKGKSLLILDHPFFGTAVSRRPLIYTDAVRTAAMAATGQMYINPDFIENGTPENGPLTVRNIMFLLAHEGMHYMLCHGLRRKHRDPTAWNIAADKVINDTLEDAKVGDPIKGGVFMRDARNYAAEELYDENDSGTGVGGIGSDIGDPTDENGNPLDEAQIHQLEAQAKIDAIQSAKAAKAVGKLPASIERLVDQLVNVTTPWHDILERFMQSKVKDGYSWNRPNRRFVGAGLYLPGVDYTPRMGEIIIALDTSGSIGQDEINMFNAHINRILQSCLPEKVHVIYCDSRINGIDEYTPDDLPITAKCLGGGGTSFRPVFEWADNYDGDIECIVYLTDGYGDQNSITTNHETVWLTTAHEQFSFGTVIKFKE